MRVFALTMMLMFAAPVSAQQCDDSRVLANIQAYLTNAYSATAHSECGELFGVWACFLTPPVT